MIEPDIETKLTSHVMRLTAETQFLREIVALLFAQELHREADPHTMLERFSEIFAAKVSEIEVRNSHRVDERPRVDLDGFVMSIRRALASA